MAVQTATVHPLKAGFHFRFGIFPRMLVAMCAVALLPLTAIWYVDYQRVHNEIATGVEQRLHGTTERLTTHVNDWVAMNVRALRQNASLPGMASMDGARQTAVLKSMLGEYEWSYLVFTIRPDGSNAARSDGKGLLDYADRVYFKEVMAGAPLGKQVVVSKTTGKPSLILAVPIYTAEKSIAGVLAMGVSIADLSQYVAGVRIGRSGYAFLLDEGGKVVAHQQQEFANSAADFTGHPAFSRADGSQQRKLAFVEDGRKVLAHAQRTEYGWTLIAQQDHDEAYAALAKTNRDAAALLSIAALAAVVLAYISSQRLVQPLRQLTAVADEISRGRMGVAVTGVDRRDEIGALAQAIERMSVSIRMALERLRMRA